MWALVAINAAYLVSALALLFRDVLWLRLLSVVSNAGFIAAYFLMPARLNAVGLLWTLLFLVINMVQLVILIVERSNTRLNAEDEELHAGVFPHISIYEFKILLRQASRLHVPQGTVLVEPGHNRSDVLLLENGAIRLESERGDIERLKMGDMLGEIAFVTDRSFSSRAVVEEDCRVVAWDRTQLHTLFTRRPSIGIGFHAAYIGQLRRGTALSPTP